MTVNATAGDACMSPASANKTSSYGWTPDVDPVTVQDFKRRCTQRVYPTGSKCYAENTTVFVWVATKWPNATLVNGTAVPASWFQTTGHLLNATLYNDSYPCGTSAGSVAPDGGVKSTTTAGPITQQTQSALPTSTSKPSGAVRLVSHTVALVCVIIMGALM